MVHTEINLASLLCLVHFSTVVFQYTGCCFFYSTHFKSLLDFHSLVNVQL